MQFSIIATIITLAMAVSAVPTNPPPNTPPPTNQCSQGLTTSCCNKNGFLANLIGVGCVNLNVVGTTCSPNQQLSCCQGDANGNINVLTNFCPNIVV